jgi:hypothetical protein
MISFLLLHLVTSIVTASPATYRCLSDDDATTLVQQVVRLYTIADAKLAREVLTTDFEEFSDSVNFLSPDQPVRTPVCLLAETSSNVGSHLGLLLLPVGVSSSNSRAATPGPQPSLCWIISMTAPRLPSAGSST